MKYFSFFFFGLIVWTPSFAKEILEAPPSACFITFQANQTIHSCSGTLVSDRIILTAAHCIPKDFSKLKSGISVGCGLISESITGGEFTFKSLFSVMGFKINPRYSDHNAEADTAFLVLGTRASGLTPMAVSNNFETFRKRFLLRSTVDSGSYVLAPSTECRISGFGRDTVRGKNYFRTMDKSPRNDQKVYVSGDTERYPTLVIHGWGTRYEEIRHGDSGSAFYCRNRINPQWLLVAITSQGIVGRQKGSDLGTTFYALTVSASFRNEISNLEGEIRKYEEKR